MKKSGTSLGTILLVIFIILKLTGNITWSWLWVLSPLWIGLAFWAIIGGLGLLLAFIFGRK